MAACLTICIFEADEKVKEVGIGFVGYWLRDNCPTAVPTNQSRIVLKNEDKKEVCAILSTKYPSSVGSNLPRHQFTKLPRTHDDVARKG